MTVKVTQVNNNNFLRIIQKYFGKVFKKKETQVKHAIYTDFYAELKSLDYTILFTFCKPKIHLYKQYLR